MNKNWNHNLEVIKITARASYYPGLSFSPEVREFGVLAPQLGAGGPISQTVPEELFLLDTVPLKPSPS